MNSFVFFTLSPNDSNSFNHQPYLYGCSFFVAMNVETRVNRNLKKDVCANHNYGLEVNLINAVRRYLRYIGSWPKL
ncbi:MAG: hypothetical protein WA667_25590 [Candidatus Nitrosopolaris sp.]